MPAAAPSSQNGTVRQELTACKTFYLEKCLACHLQNQLHLAVVF